MNENIIINILKQELVDKNIIYPFIADLTNKEKLVLELRKQGITLLDIGKRLKLTKERIRQIEEKANSKIDYQNKIVIHLAKKLSSVLFTEAEVEKAFLNYFSGVDYSEAKLNWTHFSKILWKEKNESDF